MQQRLCTNLIYAIFKECRLHHAVDSLHFLVIPLLGSISFADFSS
jgi:hypothetical protein